MKEDVKNEAVKERSILVPFIVGGVVGAGIALLLAPKSGKELRKDITNIAEDTRMKVGTLINTGRDLIGESSAAVKGAIDAGKQAFVEERDRHLKAA